MLNVRSLYKSLFICVLLLSACNESIEPQSSESNGPDISAEQEAAQQLDYNGNPPGHRLYKDPSWPLEIRKEIYGDPEIFSTPRVQFTAEMQGDSKFKRSENRSLWSMRLDGSDVRLVADEELLNYKDGGISHTPIRSPNNRYVALSLSDADDNFFRAIIDLKEQKKWIISEGGGPPHFNWTSDSENLIFYTDGDHYNYNIPSKTLSERPIIHSRGLFLLPDDKQFLAFKGNGYYIHSFEGDLQHKVEFEFDPPPGVQHPRLSADGDYFYFSAMNIGYLVNLKKNTIEKQLNRSLKSISGLVPLFAHENDYMYLYDCCVFTKLNLNTLTAEYDRKKLVEMGIWTIHKPMSISVFNHISR